MCAPRALNFVASGVDVVSPRNFKNRRAVIIERRLKNHSKSMLHNICVLPHILR